LFDKYYVYQDV